MSSDRPENSSATRRLLMERRPAMRQTPCIPNAARMGRDLEKEHAMNRTLSLAFASSILLMLLGAVPQLAAAQNNTTGVEGKVYQATVTIPANSAELAGDIATIAFPEVPKGKRLTVTYVSLRYTSYSIILDAALTNGQSGSDLQEIDLPGALAISLGVLDGASYTTSRYSGPVTFTIDGGSTPTMTFYGLGADSPFGGAVATVIGTLSSE